MRWFPPALLIVLVLPHLCAQEQERKLIDRLLKPDLALQNSAQNKQFGTRSASRDRPLTTKRFFWQHKVSTKTFSDARSFSELSFQTSSFKNHPEIAASSLTSTMDKSDFTLKTSTVEVHHATDSEKNIDEHNFAGNRPFLGQGKSQKGLNARKKPLTIEQVRELLNKNR